MKNKPKIIILGAGLAGLATSIQLKEHGLSSVILEKENKAGGLFTSLSFAGCDFDLGPKILLLNDNPNSEKILAYLNNNFKQYPVRERVFLKQYGLLHYPLQRHLFELPAKIKDKILSDIKIELKDHNREVVSFKDWLIKNFGSYLANMVLIPYEEKKWKTDLSQMDYRWALKRPIKVNLEDMLLGSKTMLPSNKVYYYPKQGNISFLSKNMAKKADTIIYNNEVIEIDFLNKKVKTNLGKYSYDFLISTLPIDSFVAMTKPVNKDFKNKANKWLQRLSIVIFNLVFENAYDLEGTAIYFPEHDFVFRRVSILQNLCPALARKDKTPISVEVSVPFGGKINHKKLLSQILADLSQVEQFKKLTNLISYRSQLVDFAYPVQTRGNSYFVGQLHRYYAQHQIYHCGRGGNFDYCNGDQAFNQGVITANKIMNQINIGQQKDVKTKVTVGIPSYQSGHSIIKTVESIFASKFSDTIELEIIVAVDGPTLSKNIETSLRKYPIKIFKNKTRQGQTARNSQIFESNNSDILIMTQDDVVFEKSTIQHIVNEFNQDLHLTMVAPLVLPMTAKKYFEKVLQVGVNIARNVATRWRSGDNYLSSIGRCLAYRTDMAQSFVIDPKVINCDAYYYLENKRLGGKFKYLPQAKVYYRLPQNLNDHLKQVRKFIISENEMKNYLKMDLYQEYKIPKKIFLTELINQFIKSPWLMLLYLVISAYTRTRPKKFYQEVTNLWEIDKSTKNI